MIIVCEWANGGENWIHASSKSIFRFVVRLLSHLNMHRLFEQLNGWKKVAHNLSISYTTNHQICHHYSKYLMQILIYSTVQFFSAKFFFRFQFLTEFIFFKNDDLLFLNKKNQNKILKKIIKLTMMLQSLTFQHLLFFFLNILSN